MKSWTALCIPALFAALFALPSVAQDKGLWHAASRTANSITGDIILAENRITINFTTFALVEARVLAPAEVSAAFDADVNAGATGHLYHVTVPANQRFLHHNTLCGTEQTEWMATYVSGRTLQATFFSGAQSPVFSFEALRNSSDVCGTFTYAR